jgi:hypothetical protein
MQINQKQGSLALEIDKQTEIQGIGMGVLKDGTPFLNQRGLARLAGIENAHIGTISSQSNDAEQKPRIRAIKELLASRGITVESPHLVLTVEGKPMYAYPDKVSLAILEYYAFEAGNNFGHRRSVGAGCQSPSSMNGGSSRPMPRAMSEWCARRYCGRGRPRRASSD